MQTDRLMVQTERLTAPPLETVTSPSPHTSSESKPALCPPKPQAHSARDSRALWLPLPPPHGLLPSPQALRSVQDVLVVRIHGVETQEAPG